MTTSDEHATLEQRYRDATAALDAAATDAFEKLLQPFADTFAHLHQVTLGELPTSQAVPELDDVDVGARETARAAVEDLIQGDTARVIHAALLLSVRTAVDHPNLVGAAVTAVPRLRSIDVGQLWADGLAKSRAARPHVEMFLRQTHKNLAKNKTLLILGIGSLGAFAIAGLTAVWKDEQDEPTAKVEEERQAKLRDVATQRTELLDALNTDRLLFATERAEQAAYTLARLVDIGLNRLPAVEALVSSNTEYTAYATTDRLLVAELAGLAQTTAALMAASVGATASHELPDDNPDVTLEAAHQVVSRYMPQRHPGSDAAPVISWAAGVINTSQQRDQLAYLATQPERIQRLEKRCKNNGVRVQEGFHFEWLHELGFNLDALANDSELRAHVTEWLGRPGDAADIVIQTPDGALIREVQAKVLESPSKRAGVQNGVADIKYENMILLVPTEHTPGEDPRFNNLLNRPEGNVFQVQYDDARDRITDHISVDGIASEPITTGKLSEATADPDGYLRQVSADIEVRRSVSAAVTAGGAAVFTSLASDITTHLLSEGCFDGFNWAEAGVASARTGAATTVAAGAGTLLEAVGARRVAAGSTNPLHDSLAHGDHGPAIVQATVEIAAVAHGLATNRLTPAEAAAATGEAVIASAITWVCTAVARKSIPDHEVAALVGGYVGLYGGKLVAHGIRVAVLGRDPDPQWDAAYDALLVDTAALEHACAADREELAALGHAHRIAFTEHVLPALDRLTAPNELSMDADPDADLVALAAIADQFAGAPLFDTLEAFDAFMADPHSILTLDLGTS